ncbi:MAG: family 43 glycosylhydrolase [Defluviitaleaceae bacterium]|nr:family 43 glycosylhydrolase [Defluviitaleaceae bacterium]
MDIIMELLTYEPGYMFRFHHVFGYFNYPSHWHNAVEVVMAVEKNVIVEANMETYLLKESEIMIIPPGDIHSFRTEHSNCQFIVVQFDLQILDSIQGLISAAYAYAQRRVISREKSPALQANIAKLLLDMQDENLKREPHYQANIVNKILDMTVHFSRNPDSDEPINYERLILRREGIVKLNECLAYINTHYTEPLTLETVAEIVGFSKFHFARWFLKYAGVSFSDYLDKLRINKVEAMLLSSHKPISDIAFEAGFQSTVTFNRIFKEHKKCTPTEYRKYHYIKTALTPKMPPVSDDVSASDRRYAIKMRPPLSITQRRHSGKLFSNPVIWADVPDPDIIRVGSAYYMVSTSMYFSPHCPIMKSYDLVNWEIVNYACDILEDSDAFALRNRANAYRQGTWAASLRYHNGIFYVVCASFTTSKTYIFSTESIENGPWVRYSLDGAHHHASLLFDDDGRVYIISGAGALHLMELTSDATAIKPSDGLYCIPINNADAGGKDGLPAEGAHLYKINGRYYLFLIAWPSSGNGRRIQLCYRADHIEGPYEGRVILDDDLGYMNRGVAQGGIFDTPSGEWYAMLHQDHGAVGRVPILAKVRWEDDWPVIDISRDMAIPIQGRGQMRIASSDEFYNSSITKSFTATNNTCYLYKHIDEKNTQRVLSGNDEELLENGNFLDSINNWEYTDIARLNVEMDKSLGKPVLYVSKRATTGSGPKQSIIDKVKPGGVYEITVKIKYMAGPLSKKFYVSILRGTGWEDIENMAQGTLYKGEWGVIKGTYVLPVDSKSTNAAIFIETPYAEKAKYEDDLMDFYVESVSMVAKPTYLNHSTVAGENDLGDSRLDLVWQWNHNPDHNLWSLTERPGYLRLKTGYLCQGGLTEARNTLTQRTFGPVCAGVAALDISGMKEGDIAGLAALQNLYGYVGVRADSGTKSIVMVSMATGSPVIVEAAPLVGDRVYLRADFDFTNAADKVRFFYSEDEIHWHVIGNVLPMQYDLTHFTGYRLGLFYYATQVVGGHVDFDYFRISDSLAKHDRELVILNAKYDGTKVVKGINNAIFELTIHMDALPDNVTYKGVSISIPVPNGVDVEDVIFCNDNISGNARYEISDNRLQLFVEGKEVDFYNKASDLFALLRFKVVGYVACDTVLTFSTDYIYVDGGNISYCTHNMYTTVELKAIDTHAKGKPLGYTNPLISHKFGAEPCAMEYDGRLYIYMASDTYEYNERGRIIDNTHQKINNITVISTTDMINWVDHGEICIAGADGVAKWATHSWAPIVAWKKIDGIDRFALYFKNGEAGTGVLVADTPLGPWQDPLGAPISNNPSVGDIGWCDDFTVPMVNDGVFNYKGQWFIVSHTHELCQALGEAKGYRSPKITKISFTPDGRTLPVKEDVIAPLGGINPYETIPAETYAWRAGATIDVVSGGTGLCVTGISDGDWLAVANVNFSETGAVRFNARVASRYGSEIEIRLDSPSGPIAGTLITGATGSSSTWETRHCDVANITGVYNVFFVFRGDSDRDLLSMDYWWFDTNLK